MASTTIIVSVVDALGFAMWRRRDASGRMPVVEIRSTPAAAFTDEQPERIPITMSHSDDVLGELLYLEHAVDGCTDLRGVGVLDDVEPEQITGLYASGDVVSTTPIGSTAAKSCRLEAVGLVGATANVGARPITVLGGDYRNSWERQRWSRPPKIVERAAQAHRTEHRSAYPGPLRIHRPSDPLERLAAGLEPRRYERPVGVPIEHSRHGGRVLSVSW